MTSWKYCGGNRGRHLNYFNLCCKDYELPELVNKCVCGHTIEENFYITNGTQILVLGNGCIQKFITKSSRTCEDCGRPHKNREVNKCNKCRKGICENCHEECNYKYTKCYDCVFK